MVNKDEDTVVYCGGCGHKYFNEPKVSLARAEEMAKTVRCYYCLEDAEADRRNPRPDRPVEDINTYDCDHWRQPRRQSSEDE